MRVTMVATACLAVFVATGCSNASEPSPPPAPVDSLTDTSEDPPPDSETETETETSSAPPPDDVEETTQAGGPPELPPEATEQTEAGADAFARNYLERINSLSVSPEPHDLASLANDSCETCDNFEDLIDFFMTKELQASRTPIDILSSDVEDTGDYTIVIITANQAAYNVIDSDGAVEFEYEAVPNSTFQFNLLWVDETWVIDRLATDAP